MNGLITNLNIYFSDACNLQCSYCCMNDLQHQQNNIAIRQALADGSFLQHVKNYLTSNITSIGLWGYEPSINVDYYEEFITQILNYSPYIRYIMIPTNGIKDIYKTWIEPLYKYTHNHQRKIKLIIQVSLDGPFDIMQAHNISYNQTNLIIQHIQAIPYLLPRNDKFLKLVITTKSTLTISDFNKLSSNSWGTFMEKLSLLVSKYNHPMIKIDINMNPTLSQPANYNENHGNQYGSLFINTNFSYNDTHECAAGITSQTIDYQGNIYDCQLLKNKDKSIRKLKPIFEEKVDRLIDQNKLPIGIDRNRLFNLLSYHWCWAIYGNDIPDSLLLILGNA